MIHAPGTQQGSTIDINDLDVIDGYFAAELDFSINVFNGDARWLETTVAQSDGSDPCTLRPRIEITPVPYALQTRGIFVDNAGNVGMGTSSPGQELQVYQPTRNVYIRAESDGGYAFFQADGARNSGLRIEENGTTKANVYWNIASQCLSLNEGGVDRLVVKGRNVGIGTQDPLYDLHVYDSAGNAYVKAESESGYAFFLADGSRNSGYTIKENGTTKADVYWNTANNSLSLAEGSVDRLVVKYGKVGIGMASPQGILEVSHDGAAHDLVVNPSTGNVGIGTTTPSGVLYTSSKNMEIEGTAPSIVLDDTEGTYQNNFEIVNGGDKVLFRDATAGIDVMALELSGARNTIVRALEITGGSDLSERFEVSGENEQVKPGMVVCIDPESPGDLMVSKTTYDRTVAGIVSGAGGVKPGMLMGQKGTEAYGKHPVALTGRVYCWADASKNAIEPGDLLTTSDTPGHAMKVTDYNKSQGATLGKAMTSLKEGKDLVLVLVSLQ